MVVIDISILNIAMPTLSRTMNASLEEIEWALIAYSIALTGLVPFFGRISDVVGRKRLFLMGLLIFATASLLAGLSPSILWLIAARLLQAVGGALLRVIPRNAGQTFMIWGIKRSGGGKNPEKDISSGEKRAKIKTRCPDMKAP